jgi:hypothetical protein
MAYWNGKEWVSQTTTQPYTTGVGTYKAPTTPKAPTAPKAPTTPKSPNFSQTTLDTQKKLNAENKGKPGYVPLAEDGIMGPKTMDAINASQFAPLPKTYTPASPTTSGTTGETQPQLVTPRSYVPTTGSDSSKNLEYLREAASTPYPKQSMEYYDPQYYVDQANKQLAASKESGIEGLRAAYDKARTELTGQTPAIQQNAQNALNSNDVYYYTQGLPQLRAAMEQTGQYGGGEMLNQNVNLLAMRGQNANDINVQANNQLQQLKNAVAQLNAEQPLKEAELSSSMDAAGLAAALQAANTGVQNQLAAANQSFNQSMQTQQFQADQSYRTWQQQMAQDEAAWARSSSNPNVAAQILSNEAAKINLQYLPDQLKAELQRIQQDISNGRLTTQSQLEETRARIRQIGASISQGQQQIDNQQANQSYARSTEKVNNYKSQIDQMYLTPSYDDYSGKITRYSYNTNAIRDYIRNLNTSGMLSDSEAKQLLALYGFSY